MDPKRETELAILIRKARAMAIYLHSGVAYGKNGKMLDQVTNTATIVSQNKDLSKEEVMIATIAAWLHKSWEAKRIQAGIPPLSNKEVSNKFGEKVAHIVTELSREPNEKYASKTDEWNAKTAWAKELSKEAQLILLAEKKVNFETSRDNPSMDKPLPWHLEYFATRSIMVDALAPSFPALAQEINQVRAQGESAIQQKIKEQQRQYALRIEAQKDEIIHSSCR